MTGIQGNFHSFEDFAAFEGEGHGTLELLDGCWRLVDFRKPLVEWETATENES